jgi:hypothetical protein
MSQKTDPEAMEPTSVQSFVQSDRNPAVTEWGDGGGPIPVPAIAEERVTRESPALSPDTGLKY